MPFTINYHKDVVKHDIPALSADMKARIRNAIEKKLTTHPEQFAVLLRRTLKGYWKLRVGDYRIVFEFDCSMIIILGIGHRRDIYERLEARRDLS